MGGADGVGRSRARAGFFAPLRSAQNDKVIFILRRILSPVILRSAATKDLALARFFTTGGSRSPSYCNSSWAAPAHPGSPLRGAGTAAGRD